MGLRRKGFIDHGTYGINGTNGRRPKGKSRANALDQRLVGFERFVFERQVRMFRSFRTFRGRKRKNISWSAERFVEFVVKKIRG